MGNLGAQPRDHDSSVLKAANQQWGKRKEGCNSHATTCQLSSALEGLGWPKPQLAESLTESEFRSPNNGGTQGRERRRDGCERGETQG